VKKLALLLASLALTLLAGGCGSQGSSADYPADFKVVAGDASAIVTWTAEPDVDYWIFYGKGDSVTTSNWASTGGAVITKATSPRVITGLANGTTYSFTINGRKDGGPGGSGAPTQVVVPQLAGANWALGAPLGTGVLRGIAAGFGASGSAVIAVGANGAIFTSIGGAATTAPANPAAPADLNAVWYGGSGFVAAGANGTILHSLDGTTWEAQASTTTANLNGVASLPIGGYVAVGNGGAIVASTGGTSWVPATPLTGNHLNAAVFGNNSYVAVGANGTILMNTEGTWTQVASPTTADLRGVSYAALSTTTDGTTTTTHVYVAIGAAGTVLVSNDATNWTAQTPISARDLTSIVYGGQFVAVGKAGVIFTSPDGVAWTARASGTTADLNAIARTQTGYTAVGDAGTNVSSF